MDPAEAGNAGRIHGFQNYSQPRTQPMQLVQPTQPSSTQLMGLQALALILQELPHMPKVARKKTNINNAKATTTAASIILRFAAKKSLMFSASNNCKVYVHYKTAGYVYQVFFTPEKCQPSNPALLITSLT